MPLSLESLVLGISEKLKLPGFGEYAFGPGMHLRRKAHGISAMGGRSP